MTNKEAISILYHLKKCLNDDMFFEAIDLAIKALENEPKKGRWIRITKNTANTQMWICSECGRTVEKITDLEPEIFFPFCHCGADMREVDNE